MSKYSIQTRKTGALAATMAASATSATLAASTFGTPTGKQIITIDGDDAVKAADFLCTIAGTAITSMTLLNGSDVEHAEDAPVWMGMVDEHSDFIFNYIDDNWVDSSKDETWVYASASTFTIAGVDLTTKYTKGTKLRFKQGGGFKYYIVSSSSFSTNTTVNVIANTDYTIANATITEPAYSYVENPQGFPSSFAYTPTGIAASNVTLTGRYRVSGVSSIHVDFYATFSGAITFTTMPTLPVAANSTGLGSGISISVRGVGGYEDNLTAFSLGSIFASVIDGATTFSIKNSAGTNMSASSPITWAANDKLWMQLDYEF